MRVYIDICTKLDVRRLNGAMCVPAGMFSFYINRLTPFRGWFAMQFLQRPNVGIVVIVERRAKIARVSFDDAREETEAISTASCAVNYRSAGERRQRRKCADDLGIHPQHFERIPGRGLGQRRSLRRNGRCLDTCACAESCRENRQTRKSPTLHYPSQDRQARLPSRDYAGPASPAQGISPRNSAIPPVQSAGDAPRPP